VASHAFESQSHRPDLVITEEMARSLGEMLSIALQSHCPYLVNSKEQEEELTQD